MPEPQSTQYNLLLFASLKDAAGAGEIAVSNRADCTVQELLQACGEQFPILAPWLEHVRVAVNCEYADVTKTVSSHDEIAILPPVAGG